MSNSPDVAVVGAGPGGCATALAFQQRGAQVVVLESATAAPRRLAGEWLHPRGVRALGRLGVDLSGLEHARAKGFLVFPDDGTGPITLRYPSGSEALCVDHAALVARLRDTLRERPGIRFAPGNRVTGVRGTELGYLDTRTQVTGSLRAGLLVGADGRSSVVRDALLGTRRHRPAAPPDRRVSRMAGVLLTDVELPVEGYGHLFLAGPGPVFAYRVGPRTVRACVDVPLHPGAAGAVHAPREQRTTRLWDAYAGAFPSAMRAGFRRALQAGRLTWAVNDLRARTVYGDAHRALVGDAVGHFHPLTAVGLTLAVTDGIALADSAGVDPYRRQRLAQTQVAEVLASALYRTFTADDPATVALRQSVYELWRQCPRERDRTMRLLALEDTHPYQFGDAFLHTLALAVRHEFGRELTRGHWRESARMCHGFCDWLGWLGCSAGRATARQTLSHLPRRP